MPYSAEKRADKIRGAQRGKADFMHLFRRPTFVLEKEGVGKAFPLTFCIDVDYLLDYLEIYLKSERMQ